MYVRVQKPILSLFINYFIWFYGAISTGGEGGEQELSVEFSDAIGHFSKIILKCMSCS